MTNKNTTFQILINVILILIACACVIPFLLLIISSLTDEQTIIKYGYSFFPRKFSLYAYEYLKTNAVSIFRAYGVTIFITAVGTSLGLTLMAMLAYALSRKDLPHSNLLTFVVFFTMLFNGGLVPTYLVYTRLFDIKNTLLALIIPFLLVKAFYVLLMRTFFIVSVPASVIESAKIDGASEWRIFWQIAMPLSVPVLATVGLFQAVQYWNDWFNGMIFLTDAKLFSIQNLLNRILLDIQFLASNDIGASVSVDNIPTLTVRMALAVIGVLPIILIYPFFQKYFVKGITVGAIKE